MIPPYLREWKWPAYLVAGVKCVVFVFRHFHTFERRLCRLEVYWEEQEEEIARLTTEKRDKSNPQGH